MTDPPLPPGWERRKRAIVEEREFDGKFVMHVQGWHVIRHCGCFLALGMRMDKHEATAGVEPCSQHGAHVERVLDLIRNSPPSEREMGQMFAEELERELTISPA
jgi:hypothetical protein